MATKTFYLGFLCLLGFNSCLMLKPIPKNTSIAFERTACYGTCPIYKLTVDNRGHAVFQGERFTNKIGRWEYTLEKSELRDILDAFKAVKWESLNAEYPARVSDLPSVVYHFTYKKIDKEVIVSGEHPVELDLLSTKMDNLVANGNWIQKVAN